LSWTDADRVDWQEIASEVARATGLGILCVANCDWLMDDDCDEEATLFAFDVSDLPEEYRNDHRNEITPVDPATAPTADDFNRHRFVKEIITAHLSELAAVQAKARLVVGEDFDAIAERIAEVKQAEEALEVAGAEELFAAVEALDFDTFVQLSLQPEAARHSVGM
jgi:hypothetical protein